MPRTASLHPRFSKPAPEVRRDAACTVSRSTRGRAGPLRQTAASVIARFQSAPSLMDGCGSRQRLAIDASAPADTPRPRLVPRNTASSRRSIVDENEAPILHGSEWLGVPGLQVREPLSRADCAADQCDRGRPVQRSDGGSSAGQSFRSTIVAPPPPRFRGAWYFASGCVFKNAYARKLHAWPWTIGSPG